MTAFYTDPMLDLWLGDCVEVMRELEPESVDAIVTDPPYGLEFMGKEWDRLGDVGQASHQGFDTEGKFKGFKLASYNASANVKCRLCNRWKWDHEGRKCECEAPDFANVKADQSRRMQAWHESWAREAFRVAKPGAHLLAFGGTRTYHRLASAIEDAGWEIRDCLVWAYASGFPKSLDVSKAIDRAAGAEREKIANGNPVKRMIPGADQNATGSWIKDNGREYQPGVELAATPDAARWDGWGTALKPAWEPIVLARKPLRGTVAGNVLEYGTGALNIDATRIGSGSEAVPTFDNLGRDSHGIYGDGLQGSKQTGQQTNYGRWPANLILTDPIFDGGVPGVVGGGETEVAKDWGASTGALDATSIKRTHPAGHHPVLYGDSGTYSRFFKLQEGSGCYLCGRARSADEATSLSESQPASAPSPAPIGESSGIATTTGSPTTNGTGQTSWHDDVESTPSIPRSRRRGTSPESTHPSSPARSTDVPSPATGTTTTTVARWTCDTCAALTTSAITFEPGDTRFLLIPKSSRSDREPVVRGTLESREVLIGAEGHKINPMTGRPVVDVPRANVHPTVKPVELMRHLVRLVTPPGGTVLDCFLGSGSTAIAANAEGFRCIGIEREREYVDIAVARLAHQPIGMAL